MKRKRRQPPLTPRIDATKTVVITRIPHGTPRQIANNARYEARQLAKTISKPYVDDDDFLDYLPS